MDLAQLWTLALWLLAGLTLSMGVVGFCMLVQHVRNMSLLAAVSVEGIEQWPSVSLIAPARNEERNVAEAMRSLLALDYPNLQITVVNDRSTDQTGAILERLAAAEPRLNVVTVTDLPSGWLGKNHAMELGASQSRGEWLLFTDADVVFHPLALKQGVAFALRHGADHLSAFPDLQLKHWFLRAVVITFVQQLVLFVRPWQVRQKKSRAYMGVGAFNLVRSEAYRAAGGHQKIRLRPDDDLRLGQILKQAGFQSDVIDGRGAILVEWYSSLGEMIRGLEKNSAAPLEYNSCAILAACALLFFGCLWPFVAPWFTTGALQGAFVAGGALLVVNNLIAARHVGQPLWLGLFYPAAMSVFLFIQLRALVLLWYYGGIHWRGTFYPLQELKANRLK